MNDDQTGNLLKDTNSNINNNQSTLFESLHKKFNRHRKPKAIRRNNSTRSSHDQFTNLPRKPMDVGRATIDIRQPTLEHLDALKIAFNKILNERLLSDESRNQRKNLYEKLRNIILDVKPDSQINLYGSLFFYCCLEKPGIMDIDVQFRQSLQYDTLKELLEILMKNDICKEARINTDHWPSCIDLITYEPNIHLRITAGYNRGINLSRLIRIYMKFDSRVLTLLRLFRILSKICNIDKTDIGTLHPIVFHLMVIHFLQQIDPPILPCLHEYIFGIDQVPITLNDNYYPEFFRLSNEYSQQWKSLNNTSSEMLFLQLLSYYTNTFNFKQFVVSIQTRMPVVKIDKNWRCKKLLVEDPTDIRRSLCHTMQADRSISYFHDTLNAALNYFGRKQKKIKKTQLNSNTANNISTNPDDDYIEVIIEDEIEIPRIEANGALHSSYELFTNSFPIEFFNERNIRQDRVRDYYKKKICYKKMDALITINSTLDQNFDNLNESEIEKAFEDGFKDYLQTDETNDDDNGEQNIILGGSISSNVLDEDFITDFNEINIEQDESTSRQLFSSTNEEDKLNETNSLISNSTQNEQDINGNKKTSHDNSNERIVRIDKSLEILNKKQRQMEKLIQTDEHSKPTTTDSYETVQLNDKSNETVKLNDKPDETMNVVDKADGIEIHDTKENSDKTSCELFYDFQPENFHAEQGAPFVCTVCNDVGHLKSECHELILPNMIDLSEINQNWIDVLSLLCHHITDKCKPNQIDIDNREEILKLLRKKFSKVYSDCDLLAFGSFYNGFGFRQSDLDVCFLLKDQREENANDVLKIMKTIQKSIRSNPNIFDNVQPVLHAKVPIIRSRHRQLQIDIDISFHNMLAIENTRLLKTYTDIDERVSQIGYMVKHLAKLCQICDASRGTLSSYAYIIMVIHFLQQIQPSVLPVLQQLSDDSTKKSSMYKKCSKWNVYFYDNLTKLNDLWKNENKLSVGALWIEFLRYYTERFNYDEHVITIRQKEPLLKHDKDWLQDIVAIEDPFELSHNLAGRLSIQRWTSIRRVFIRARQQFCVQPNDIDLSNSNIEDIESILFNVDDLCRTNTLRLCTECKQPYHTRKRCPKFIQKLHENLKPQQTNVNEKQKQKQQQQQHKQQTPRFQSRDYYRDIPPYNSRFYSNNNYYHRPHGYQYVNISPMSHQRVWTQPYSNERSIAYPNLPYYVNQPMQQQQFHYDQQSVHHFNVPFPTNNQRQCFLCGSPNHLMTQCSQFQANSFHQ